MREFDNASSPGAGWDDARGARVGPERSEGRGETYILPDASARQQPIPTITTKDARPASEVVTAIIPLKYVSAAQLVPILRPMIPQYGHLVALPSANTLLIVDRFANVRRIEALARSLDTPENKPAPTKEPERQ